MCPLSLKRLDLTHLEEELSVLPHTLFQLPRLLVESEGFDVVLVRLVDHGVRDHLSVHPPEHDLRSDDVLGSRGNRLSLVKSVMIEDECCAHSG